MMGYYTYYSLVVRNDDKIAPAEITKASHRLAEIMGEDNTNSPRFDNFEWISYDSMKWYDHEEHMRTLAAEFPDMLLVLYGVGEESDDRWVEYYQGNRCHTQGWHWDPTPQWTHYKRRVST